MENIKGIKGACCDLEAYFKFFRDHTIGVDQEFISPYGIKRIIYADWTASGRLYRPIEEKLMEVIGPFVANTHSETSVTGASMTLAYHQAKSMIKNHVNAKSEDVLVTVGTGMTGAINKLQRLMGLKVSEQLLPYTLIPDALKPIVFLSHMEHHSNHTSWLETIAEVQIIPPTEDGLICLKALNGLLETYQSHPIKIVAITACSNVTGIKTNYHQIAKIAHAYNGLCFVDFACSAPYVDMNMHPEDPEAYLDAITFSPHKFLGGPGTSGILIFNKKLYRNLVPDISGGGTVSYTNPWGVRDYIDDVETREDGGTPGFLQAIRTALCMQLKAQMGVENILQRESDINKRIFRRLSNIQNLVMLAGQHTDRLGIFSFYVVGCHYNLLVKLLNDRFGIQTRGGCSCAGTYGHYLLQLDEQSSRTIEKKIMAGCLIERPGWVRMSIHPTMPNHEIDTICDAIEAVVYNHVDWAKDYVYDDIKNVFIHKETDLRPECITSSWLDLNARIPKGTQCINSLKNPHTINY